MLYSLRQCCNHCLFWCRQIIVTAFRHVTKKGVLLSSRSFDVHFEALIIRCVRIQTATNVLYYSVAVSSSVNYAVLECYCVVLCTYALCFGGTESKSRHGGRVFSSRFFVVLLSPSRLVSAWCFIIFNVIRDLVN